MEVERFLFQRVKKEVVVRLSGAAMVEAGVDNSS